MNTSAATTSTAEIGGVGGMGNNAGQAESGGAACKAFAGWGVGVSGAVAAVLLAGWVF